MVITLLPQLIESFRFEDENKHEYEIKLKVFARVLKKKKTPRKASFYLFSPQKVSTVVYSEEG